MQWDIQDSITEGRLLWSSNRNRTSQRESNFLFPAHLLRLLDHVLVQPSQWRLTFLCNTQIPPTLTLTPGAGNGSPSQRPVRRVAVGSTGPASASWRATSDGGAAWWSAACPADWPPGREQDHRSVSTDASSTWSCVLLVGLFSSPISRETCLVHGRTVERRWTVFIVFKNQWYMTAAVFKPLRHVLHLLHHFIHYFF